MSRGLSTQQRQILGLALTRNRLRHGGEPRRRSPVPLVEEFFEWNGERHSRGLKFAHVESVDADFSATFIAHAFGIPLKQYRLCVAQGRLDMTAPGAASIRASTSRSISGLYRLKLVTYKWPEERGYHLTEEGIELARPYEFEPSDAIERSWWLLRNNIQLHSQPPAECLPWCFKPGERIEPPPLVRLTQPTIQPA